MTEQASREGHGLGPGVVRRLRGASTHAVVLLLGQQSGMSPFCPLAVPSALTHSPLSSGDLGSHGGARQSGGHRPRDLAACVAKACSAPGSWRARRGVSEWEGVSLPSARHEGAPGWPGPAHGTCRGPGRPCPTGRVPEPPAAPGVPGTPGPGVSGCSVSWGTGQAHRVCAMCARARFCGLGRPVTFHNQCLEQVPESTGSSLMLPCPAGPRRAGGQTDHARPGPSWAGSHRHPHEAGSMFAGEGAPNRVSDAAGSGHLFQRAVCCQRLIVQGGARANGKGGQGGPACTVHLGLPRLAAGGTELGHTRGGRRPDWLCECAGRAQTVAHTQSLSWSPEQARAVGCGEEMLRQESMARCKLHPKGGTGGTRS